MHISIIIVHHSQNFGGAERNLLSIMEQLKKWNIPCYFVGKNPRGQNYENFKKYSTEIILTRFPEKWKIKTWSAYFSFKNIINRLIKKETGRTIILAGDVYTFWSCQLFYKKATVYCLWQNSFDFKQTAHVLKRKYLNYVSVKNTKLVASESLIKKIKKEAHRYGIQYKTLNPCLREEFFEKKFSKEDRRRKLGWEKDERIAIVVARICPEKGQFWLAKEFVKNKIISEKWKLIFVGHKLCNEEYSRIESLQHPHIFLLNQQNNIADYGKAADLIICPGWASESFGMAQVEACICQTPILLTKVGVIDQLYSSEYKGLIPYNDKEKIISLWEYYTKNEEALKKLKDSLPYKEFYKKFCLEKWQEDLKAILTDA